MKTNQKMREIFKLITAQNIPIPDMPAEGVYKVLQSGIIILDGCYLLKEFNDPWDKVIISDMKDRTGYESFMNHFHIPGFLLPDIQDCPLQVYVQSLSAAFFLRKILSEFDERLRFRIILGFNEEGEGTLRFHLIREGESLVSDDLEEYKIDAMMVLDSTDQPVDITNIQ